MLAACYATLRVSSPANPTGVATTIAKPKTLAIAWPTRGIILQHLEILRGGGREGEKKKKALIRLRLNVATFFSLFVFPSSLGEWSNFWISRCTSLCKFSLFTIKFANGGKVSIKFFVELSLTFLRVLLSFWRKNGFGIVKNLEVILSITRN